MIKKNLFFLLLLSLWILPTYAGHITGGYIRYDFEGIFSGYYKYQVEIFLYRDCSPGFGTFENTIPVGIFTGDTLIATQNVNFTGYEDLTPLPANQCAQVGRYAGTLVLSPHSTGYLLAYQRCCRNINVRNIYYPDGSGFTLTASIPPLPNSAPAFVNKFPSYMVLNQPFTYNLSALDNDADEIIYELVNPLNGGSQFNPNPNPPDSPPYTVYPYESPYSLSDIIGGVPVLAYDINAGFMTAQPNHAGIYAVALSITEKRNGQPLAVYKMEFNVTASPTYPVLIIEKENTLFSFYPNPATDFLHLSFPESTAFEGEIMDITGKTIVVFTQPEINVHSLKKGIYLLKITTEKGTEIQKCWKE